jgi:hypothetical protein
VVEVVRAVAVAGCEVHEWREGQNPNADTNLVEFDVCAAASE